MAPTSYCHIPHCHNTKYHFTFYKFPNNLEQRAKWKDACKMKEATAHMYACEKHFRSWDFTSVKKGRKKLKRGVVPTFIPDPNVPRNGKWWGPDRKSNWLKSSEVTVVTMLEDNVSEEEFHSNLPNSETYFTTDTAQCKNKPLNPTCLDKLNTSEVKIVLEKLPTNTHKDSSKHWLQNTSIFKLDSAPHNFITSQTSTEIRSNVSTHLSNSVGSPLEHSIPKTTSIELVDKIPETKSGSENLIVPTPKSYEVIIDSSGKIHMARPTSNLNPNNGDLNNISRTCKDKTDSLQNTVKEVKPISGENPAPYTVVINHNGLLDTIQTSPNMKIPAQPRDPKTGQLTLGKWPTTDESNPVAMHRQQLNITKGQLGHLYRQWISGNFNNSEETGNEQFNIMFSLFQNLMDTFKNVEKHNKSLRTNLRNRIHKQKPDHYNIKEKKAIIRETLQPYFGQDQIDIFLQHQTKRVRNWSKDAIFQAELLRRCMSRSAYRKLRESKIFPLPSLTALKTHLEKFGGMPQIPIMIPSTNIQVGQQMASDAIKNDVTTESVQLVEHLKTKSRRHSGKQMNICSEQKLLKLPPHVVIPVDRVSSTTSDGIIMVPVVHGSHLPSSSHEVVLAVDSIIP